MTPQQIETLDFVRDRISETGFAPTYQEISDHFRLASKSGAYQKVEALIAAGYLRRDAGRRRGLVLVDMPDLRAVGTSALLAELARRGETIDALPTRREIAYGTQRSCAADTCGAAVQPGHLMCRDHWFALPYELREALLRTHRRARQTGSREDARDYQALVTEARDLADGLGGR